MATITHGNLQQIGSSPEVSWVCLWETLTAANAVGDSLEMTAWSDRSVQFVGTFDSATAVLQGSNDGTNWATLTDPQGNAISKTSAGLEAISELTRYIRPSTSGGGASQDIDCYVVISGYRRW
jgi:hypothetical protein